MLQLRKLTDEEIIDAVTTSLVQNDSQIMMTAFYMYVVTRKIPVPAVMIDRFEELKLIQSSSS